MPRLSKRSGARRATPNNQLSGGSSTPWTPAALGSVVKGWFNETTLTGAGGSSLVTWNDASGNGKNAGFGNGPTVVAAGLNGMKVVDLPTGGDTGFLLPGDTMGNATAGAALVVYQHDNQSGNVAAPLTRFGSYSDNFCFWPTGTTTVYDGFGRADGRHTITVSGIDFSQWQIVFVRSANALYEWWHNGASKYSNGTNTVGWGGFPCVGRDGSISFDGRIAEIILLGTNPSAADQAKLEGYVAHKWGLTGVLPSGHAHKSTPPTASGGGPPQLSFNPHPNSAGESVPLIFGVDAPGGTGDVVAAVLTEAGATLANHRQAVSSGSASFSVARPSGAATGLRVKSTRAGAVSALSSPFGTTTETQSAPDITGTPTVSGVATTGSTLTAIPAFVTGNPPPTRTWQWQRGTTNISGATASTYVVVQADEGSTLRVIQTETNSQGSDTATSSNTAVVTAAPAAGLSPYSVALRNETNSPMAEGAATWPMFFAKAELPAGSGIKATIDGADQWAQLDPINTWSDGSMQSAHCTIRRPALTANQSKTCTISAGTPPAAGSPIDVMALIGARTITLDMTGVTIGGTGQTIPQVDVKTAVSAAISSPDNGANNPTYWRRGANLTTVCATVDTINSAFNASGMRLLFDVTVDYQGNLHVDCTASNDRVFDPSPTSAKGRFDATFTLTVDGAQRFNQAVWITLRRSAHFGGLAPGNVPMFMSHVGDINIVQPAARFSVSRATTEYDTALPVTETNLAAHQTLINADTNWMRPLFMNTFTGNSGFGTDFGSGSGGEHPNQTLLSGPAVQYIISGDVRALRRVFGWTEIGHSLPCHNWDNNAARKRWIDRSHYTQIATSRGGHTNGDPTNAGSFYINTDDPGLPATEGTTPEGHPIWFDNEHIPTSLTVAGYLFNGQPNYYRNIMALAGHAMTMQFNKEDMHHDPFYTSRYDIAFHTNAGPTTTLGPDGYRGWNSGRAISWTFLSWDNAWFFAKDSSHYRTYWADVTNTNFDAHHRALPNIKLEQGGNATDAFQGYDPEASFLLGKTLPLWAHAYRVMVLGQAARRRVHDAPSSNPAVYSKEMFTYYTGMNRKFLTGQGGLDWRNYYGGRVPLVYEWDGQGSGGYGSAYATADDWYRQPLSRIQTCTDLAAITNTWPQPVAGDGLFTGGILDYSDAGYNVNQFDPVHNGLAFGTAGLCYRIFTEWGETATATDFLNGYNLAVGMNPNFWGQGTKLSVLQSRHLLWGWTLGDKGVSPFTNENPPRS